MMKKSVLHYVADDQYGVFEDNEEAQFEMLLSLINDYHVNEEITIADQHGNHDDLFLITIPAAHHSFVSLFISHFFIFFFIQLTNQSIYEWMKEWMEE